MNRALLPEMLHCADITVLERQRARLKWQQEQQQLLQVQQQQQLEIYFSDLSGVFQVQPGFQDGLGEVVTPSVKLDPCLVDNGWPNVAGYGNNGSGFDMNYAISRTSSCPQEVAAAAAEAAAMAKGGESVVTEKMSCGVGRGNFRKRKADKVVAEDDTRDKRIKGCIDDGESKITEKNTNKSSCSNSSNNKNTKSKKVISGETSKDNSKVTEVPKPDYIHVRARRGQATDSHSLAERVRREKISERMRYLQDLVPGCNKITGKAGMLDEIINYVQSLQRQVEFLSMKLAAVNPRLDFNIDSLFTKEVFPACGTNLATVGMSSDMTNPACLQFNPAQQLMVTCSGLEMGTNPPDMSLRTICAPVSAPKTFLDSSCFTQIQPTSTWDADLQNLYNVAFDQGRSTSFPSQPFTGSSEASSLKMEM